MDTDGDTFGAVPLPPPLPHRLPLMMLLPRPPRIWPCFVLFAAVMGTMLAFSGTPLLIMLVVREGLNVFMSSELMPKMIALLATPEGLAMVAVTNVLIIGSMTVGASWLSPVPLGRRLGLERPAVSLPLMLVMAAGGVALSWWLSFLIMSMGLFDPDGSGPLAMMNRAFQEARGGMLVALVLSIGVFVPVAEELLFRGYIQSRLQMRWGATAAVVIASLLFGLLHMDLLHSPLASVMGVYLGYLAVRSGSVWPAMVVHAAINIVAVLSARAFQDKPEGVVFLTIWGGLTAVVLLAVLITYMATSRRSL